MAMIVKETAILSDDTWTVRCPNWSKRPQGQWKIVLSTDVSNDPVYIEEAVKQRQELQKEFPDAFVEVMFGGYYEIIVWCLRKMEKEGIKGEKVLLLPMDFSGHKYLDRIKYQINTETGEIRIIESNLEEVI